VFGFLIKKINWMNVLAASLAAPTAYFLLSNLTVWASNSGLKRPLTAEGLMMTYVDGLPFYQNALLGTMVFSTVLFGSYLLLQRAALNKSVQTA
jgi:hypothetical protein